MAIKELNETDITKVSGGIDEEDKDVYTWFKCFRPNCNYEFRVRGKHAEGTLRMCESCYQDSAKSTGRYEK